jgi:hypothetical protein
LGEDVGGEDKQVEWWGWLRGLINGQSLSFFFSSTSPSLPPPFLLLLLLSSFSFSLASSYSFSARGPW